MNMGACYTGVTPILLKARKERRLFLWTFNVIEYLMKLAICFLEDPKLQVIAFAIFCVVALILAIDEALVVNKTKSKGHKGHNFG